jgi:hypothetical protein
MKKLVTILALTLVWLIYTPHQHAYAQNLIQFLPTGTGDWDTPTNWQDIGAGQNVPSSNFDEIGVIGTGGTARVANPVSTSAGGAVINSGTLDVLANGSLNVIPGFGNLAQGLVDVNSGGTLSIASGASLSAQSVTSSGIVRLIGPTATLNVTDQMTFEGGGTLIAAITAASHSAISVAGTATLDGTLVADFTGHMPSANETWDLLTAPTIASKFDSITTVGLGPLPLGQVLTVKTVPGGSQGMVSRLRIEKQLVLTVHRDTGVISIDNPHGVAVPMDSYAIQSSIGSLNGGSWNSLQDQGFGGNAWFETGSGGTTHRLAELNQNGQTQIPVTSSTSLGNVYAPHFTTFGVDTEDYSFTYANLDGDITQGLINYVGDKQHNNLVLTVDPSTGQAQIRNESPFAVSIEGYAILSGAGSLLTGSGQWLSLEDQGVEGHSWFESNVGPTQIAELRDDGATFLATNQGYNIGALFNTTSVQDLTFKFLLNGQGIATTGIVVYGTLPPVQSPSQALAGDYNNNGIVDAADYVVWRKNLGTSVTLPNDTTSGMVTSEDYQVWRANFGATSGSGSSLAGGESVPEPSAAVVVLTVVFGFGLCFQRSRGFVNVGDIRALRMTHI